MPGDQLIDNRSPIRKAVSIALGVSMALLGAAGFLWLLFFANGPVKGFIWMMPIGALAAGVAILYDDLRNS